MLAEISIKCHQLQENDKLYPQTATMYFARLNKVTYPSLPTTHPHPPISPQVFLFPRKMFSQSFHTTGPLKTDPLLGCADCFTTKPGSMFLRLTLVTPSVTIVVIILTKRDSLTHYTVQTVHDKYKTKQKTRLNIYNKTVRTVFYHKDVMVRSGPRTRHRQRSQ